jgi:hypothetical protein
MARNKRHQGAHFQNLMLVYIGSLLKRSGTDVEKRG